MKLLNSEEMPATLSMVFLAADVAQGGGGFASDRKVPHGVLWQLTWRMEGGFAHDREHGVLWQLTWHREGGLLATVNMVFFDS